MKSWAKWFGAIAGILLLSGVFRFANLSQTAVRSDEISFLLQTQRNQSLIELWKNPPWLNQIPFADSVPVVWARITRQDVDEGVIRQPFALMGCLMVLFCSVWVMRHRGVGAGVLLGTWMALLPYHVYHSREAYYYIMAMLFASGMTLRGTDFILCLQAGKSLKLKQYGEWTAWTLLACLSHMAVWSVAAVGWLCLVWAGWRGLPEKMRRRHVAAMGGVTLLLGAGMCRWIWRAIDLTLQVSEGGISLIGESFAWVGWRVLPIFLGGANAVGIALFGLVLLSLLFSLHAKRNQLSKADLIYRWISMLMVFSLISTYGYIYIAGGDKAKLTYFSPNLSLVMVWAVFTLDKALEWFGPRKGLVELGGAIAIATMLILPSWQVTKLGGKPTDYHAIRSWLDTHLSQGDVVLIDRWLEPWNEMALYSPSNVTVNFTVPDEPYENYLQYQWRKATQEAIQDNQAQAFIRLSRNHEARMGLWTWPEKWFRHRAVVANAAGLWLRDTGFAPMEEFYTAQNRLETEIFYDTHEDIADRARAAGRDVVWFFGAGWKLFKPWQQGDFSDYRVLTGEASMTVHNLRGEPIRVRGEVVAAATGGRQRVQIGTLPPMTFPPDQLSRQTFELDLPPGVQTMAWKNLSPGGALLVREIRLDRVK